MANKNNQTNNQFFQTNLSKAVLKSSENVLCAEFNRILKRDNINGIQYIWKNALYIPIKNFISNKKSLENDEICFLKKFLLAGISQFKLILDKFPEIQLQIVLYMGDLYRYSYFHCGFGEDDRILAEEYYVEVLNLDIENSFKAFNQIGLLYSNNNKWKSLKFYLRYLTLTSGIERNIGFLKEQPSSLNDHQKLVLKIVKNILINFNANQFDELELEFNNQLKNLIDEDFQEDAFESVYYLSLMSIHVINFEENDMIYRKAVKLASKSWLTILQVIYENLNNSNNPIKINNMELLALTGMAEYLAMNCEKLFLRKLPISCKMEHIELEVIFVKLLNHFEALLKPLMNFSNIISLDEEQLFKNWQLNAPNCCFGGDNISYLKILAYFLKKCLTKKSTTPILFDPKNNNNNNFQSVNKNDKLIQFTKNLTKRQIEYAENQKSKESNIPVYVIPDENVLIDKISVLSNIIQSSRVTVIICKYVLAELDKRKKFNPKVRDAIRWIESSIISNQRVRLSTIVIHQKNTIVSIEDETEKILQEKNLLNRKDLFATILKSCDENIQFKNKSNYQAISIENIITFFTRLISHNDDINGF